MKERIAGKLPRRSSNRCFVRGDFGVATFGVELLDASSSPPEWLNRLELSLEIGEEDILWSLITLLDE